MKIGISAFATDSGKSGISQYAANVVGRLVALAPQHELIAFINRIRRQLDPDNRLLNPFLAQYFL